jgi:sulfur-carrier protein
MVTIELPSALQPYAQDRTEVAVEAATVAEALGALAGLHAGVVDRVLDERGVIRQHVNIFVDGENVRFLDGMRTPLHASSTIVIVPAVSGG